MSKKGNRKAAQEAALNKLLDELEGALYLLTDQGGYHHGTESFSTLILLGRCLETVCWGTYLDDEGMPMREPPAYTEDDIPDQTRRVQQAIKRARKAGATFALCYHVQGDPLWRYAWSGEFDRDQAVREMITFLTQVMLFPGEEVDWAGESAT